MGLNSNLSLLKLNYFGASVPNPNTHPFPSLGLMFGLALLSSLLKALDEYARYKAAVIRESLRRAAQATLRAEMISSLAIPVNVTSPTGESVAVSTLVVVILSTL